MGWTGQHRSPHALSPLAPTQCWCHKGHPGPLLALPASHPAHGEAELMKLAGWVAGVKPPQEVCSQAGLCHMATGGTHTRLGSEGITCLWPWAHRCPSSLAGGSRGSVLAQVLFEGGKGPLGWHCSTIRSSQPHPWAGALIAMSNKAIETHHSCFAPISTLWMIQDRNHAPVAAEGIPAEKSSLLPQHLHPMGRTSIPSPNSSPASSHHGCSLRRISHSSPVFQRLDSLAPSSSLQDGLALLPDSSFPQHKLFPSCPAAGTTHLPSSPGLGLRLHSPHLGGSGSTGGSVTVLSPLQGCPGGVRVGWLPWPGSPYTRKTNRRRLVGHECLCPRAVLRRSQAGVLQQGGLSPGTVLGVLPPCQHKPGKPGEGVGSPIGTRVGLSVEGGRTGLSCSRSCATPLQNFLTEQG